MRAHYICGASQLTAHCPIDRQTNRRCFFPVFALISTLCHFRLSLCCDHLLGFNQTQLLSSLCMSLHVGQLQGHWARGYDMRTWTCQELCCVRVLWEGLSCRCGLKRPHIFENVGRFDWTFHFMTFSFWICDKQATRKSYHFHIHIGSY